MKEEREAAAAVLQPRRRRRPPPHGHRSRLSSRCRPSWTSLGSSPNWLSSKSRASSTIACSRQQWQRFWQRRRRRSRRSHSRSRAPQPPSPPRTQSPPPPPTVAVPPATGSIDLLAVANKSDSSEPLSDDDDDDEPAPPAPPAPAPPPPALPPKAPPPTAPPPTVPPPAALPQAAPPSGGLSEAQRMRMEANRQAAVARQKQKAPPPPAPLPPAPPPPAAPTPTAPRLPALPSAAAGIVEISDALGVSSAPNLGMRDLLTLRQTIDESSSAEHLACVLRRLEMTLSPMTPELSRTGIVEAVASLTEHEDACVRDSSARITHSWSTQLAAERRRRELASRPGPKPKGTGALGCRACQGAHRAHTCE
jgi:hypothetical protein